MMRTLGRFWLGFTFVSLLMLPESLEDEAICQLFVSACAWLLYNGWLLPYPSIGRAPRSSCQASLNHFFFGLKDFLTGDDVVAVSCVITGVLSTLSSCEPLPSNSSSSTSSIGSFHKITFGLQVFGLLAEIGLPMIDARSLISEKLGAICTGVELWIVPAPAFISITHIRPLRAALLGDIAIITSVGVSQFSWAWTPLGVDTIERLKTRFLFSSLLFTLDDERLGVLRDVLGDGDIDCCWSRCWRSSRYFWIHLRISVLCSSGCEFCRKSSSHRFKTS